MRLVRHIDWEEMDPAQNEASADARADVAADGPDGEIVDDSDADTVAEAASGSDVDYRALEALLFSTHHPLTAGRLAEMLDSDSTKPIRSAVRELNRAYTEAERAFRIEQVAGGYQMLTLPEHGELLRRLHQRETDAKLSKPALETLAIIAYKQPILRAEIEGIRGVACGETIRNLMEKHLVKIAGRAEEPGRRGGWHRFHA